MLQPDADATLHVYRTHSSVAEILFNCPMVSMKVQHWLDERAIMECWTTPSPRDEQYVPRTEISSAIDATTRSSPGSGLLLH
ncbi:MAG: hypothetical protein ABI407_22450, partial [Bradyrhizobium sp.]